MSRITLGLVMSLVLVWGWLPAQAGFEAYEIYTQPPTTTPAGVATDYLSQNETSPLPDGLGEVGRVYDNFTLSQGYHITDVHWRGSYDLPALPTRPLDGFTIGFWADVAGVPDPGGPFDSQFIPGSAGETFVEFQDGLLDEVPVYDYWTFLDRPVWLDPGTYWLSIVADLVTLEDDDPFWGWHVGTDGDGESVQDFDLPPFDGDLDPAEGREFLQTDMAFSLTSVPEPASIAIWLMILTGAVYVQVRRKSHSA